MQVGKMRGGAAACVGLLMGCDVFAARESCELGEKSCDGRELRACVVNVETVVGDAEKQGRWSTERVCEDDPLLGPATCGIVEGKPACVAQRADGGVATPPSPSLTEAVSPAQWLRVDIRQEAPGRFVISAVESAMLADPPLARSTGTLAAVSYAGDKVLDATLVAFADDQVAEQSVWLRAPSATRIALLAPGASETVLSELQRPPVVAKGIGNTESGVGERVSAVVTAYAPPIVFTPEISSPALLQAVRPMISMVSPSTLSIVREINFQLDLVSRQFGQLATVQDVRTRQAQGAPIEKPVAEDRALVVNNRLYIRLGQSDLDECLKDPRHLALQVTRALGRAYGTIAVGTTLIMNNLAAHNQPTDFPTPIKGALLQRLSPLLGEGQVLTEAWAELHQSAVGLHLALPYGVATPAVGPVKAGFASVRGSVDPLSDLTEFLAYATVPDVWTQGPCAALRANSVESLPPELVLPLAKLTALRGLGLISGEQLARCVGDLRIGEEQGLVFHKPSGEKLIFSTEFQAVYQPFFAGQVHISWVAHRGFVTTSLDLGYRGVLVPAFRLSARAGHEGNDFRSGDDYAAVLAVHNATTYQTIVAMGGMVASTQIVKDTDRERANDQLEAIAFFVKFNEPLWGETVYPLVTARATKPVWGDAP